MCKKDNANEVLIEFIKSQESKKISFEQAVEYEEKNNCWFGPYFDLDSFLTCNKNLGIIKVDSIEGTISLNT